MSLLLNDDVYVFIGILKLGVYGDMEPREHDRSDGIRDKVVFPSKGPR